MVERGPSTLSRLLFNCNQEDDCQGPSGGEGPRTLSRLLFNCNQETTAKVPVVERGSSTLSIVIFLVLGFGIRGFGFWGLGFGFWVLGVGGLRGWGFGRAKNGNQKYLNIFI